MSLDDYWQENRRFVMSVVAGVVIFFIGTSVIDTVYGNELKATQRAIASTKRKLKDPLFNAQDRGQAEDENEALRKAFERLAENASFQPLERFQLNPDGGLPANQYRRIFADVFDTMGQRANRANMQMDPSLGMPKLSPKVAWMG